MDMDSYLIRSVLLILCCCYHQNMANFGPDSSTQDTGSSRNVEFKLILEHKLLYIHSRFSKQAPPLKLGLSS